LLHLIFEKVTFSSCFPNVIVAAVFEIKRRKFPRVLCSLEWKTDKKKKQLNQIPGASNIEKQIVETKFLGGAKKNKS
jgi:hypothetical protein